MKFTLTITDANASDLSRLLASLGGAATVSAGNIVAGSINSSDDDESGDAPAAANTVDGNGIPWDARIHSNPPKLTAKGVWRRKKGVDDAEVKAVEAQLKAVHQMGTAPQMTAPTMMQPPQMTAPQMMAPPQMTAPTMMQPPQMTAPQMMAPPQQFQPHEQPPQMMAPPQQATVMQYDGTSFMSRLQQLLPLNPALNQEYLNNVAMRVGTAFGFVANSITDLLANPQAINYAVQTMRSENKWQD